MQIKNLLQALLVLAVALCATVANGQSSIGIRANTTPPRQVKEVWLQDFSLSKPIVRTEDHNSVKTSSIVVIPNNNDYSEGNYRLSHFSGRREPDKHGMGIGMLIGGGVCLIAGGVLLNAAANNSMDDWGFSYIAETIGGYVATGCGIALSVTGLVLVLKYREGGGGGYRYR